MSTGAGGSRILSQDERRPTADCLAAPRRKSGMLHKKGH
jgi:hypothetical protein